MGYRPEIDRGSRTHIFNPASEGEFNHGRERFGPDFAQVRGDGRRPGYGNPEERGIGPYQGGRMMGGEH